MCANLDLIKCLKKGCVMWGLFKIYQFSTFVLIANGFIIYFSTSFYQKIMLHFSQEHTTKNSLVIHNYFIYNFLITDQSYKA